ncbi:hypothetical protein FACS1894190_06410 [Spirochaetia bacterium]|nr:hypothetical protein FACS1894190_06410 [Spirochaetia bacterium]
MADFLKQIIEGSTIGYDGKKYKVLGKAVYTTKNDPLSIYAKILLENHHVLVIAPADNIAYFGKNVGELSEFSTFAQNVSYQGKEYSRKDSDYQIVLNLEFGSPIEVEGEVKFWDYEVDDEIISIAIVSMDKTRADVVAKYISFSDLTVS